MIIRFFIVSSFLFFVCSISSAQVSCTKMLEDAKKEKDYLLALKRIEAARKCNPKLSDKADQLTIQLFNKIDALRIKAKKEEQIAEKEKQNALKAEKLAIEQKENAIKAKQKANATNAINQRILSKIEFYDDRFGLAYNGNKYGFIDRQGNVTIDYKYDKAFPFRDGFAKVYRNNVKYLIDAKGGKYRLAENKNEITEETQAVYLSGIFRTAIPNQIYALNNLVYLNLSALNLTYYPEELFDFPKLKYLNLNYCHLDSIPKNVFNLKELEFLDLSENKISSIPIEITQLKDLRYLNLSENYLKKFPIGLTYLSELKGLNLSRNMIMDKIPSQIENLKNLKKLNLSNYNYPTNDEKLPNELFNLKQLKYLRLDGNRIKFLPENIGNLSNLEKLDLSHNKIKILPDSFYNLKQLRELSLFNNDLKELPNEIEKLRSLEFFSLENNSMQTLPNSIGELKNLKKLILSSNELSEINHNIGNLETLTQLNISRNKIEFLPKEIGSLLLLEELDGNNNIISAIPNEISKLTNLVNLNLSRNNISNIPNNIGYLKNLEKLDLGGNSISSIPVSIGNLKKLSTLHLWRNEIKSIKELCGLNKNLFFSVNNNPIDTIPNCFSKFINLEKGSFNGTKIKDFPQFMCENDDYVYYFFWGREYVNAYNLQKKIIEEKKKANVEDYDDYFELSFFSLYVDKPMDAIYYAEKALELNQQKDINIASPLALGYLLNNQWEEAEKIYLKWKDKDFPHERIAASQHFLKDISDLRKAGIYHENFEKAIDLLNQ